MNKIIAILISAFLAGQTLAATVINVYPTNITTTSAYFQATITTNGGGSTGTVFYGFSDQTTNASSWSWSNDYGNITTTGTVSKQITALQQAQKFFYRWRILEGSAYTWAAGTSNFWTKAASPTSTPTPVSISVQANPTTAALMAPTNFFSANSNLILNVVNLSSYAMQSSLDACSNYFEGRADALDTSTGTLNTAVGVLNTATGSLNTAVGALQTSTQTLDGAVSDINAATGSLNTAVASLQTSTGTLNAAVTTLNTATNALDTRSGALETSTQTLDTAVATLNTATGSLNTAVGALQTSTGTLNTAVGTLNTATNSLNTRVTDLEGGGDAAGWSGFAATQRVYMAGFGVSNAAYFHGGKLVIGTGVSEPAVAGAFNIGMMDNSGDDSMIADNIGSFNIGYINGGAAKCEMIAGGAGGMCGNIGRVDSGGMYASAYGCLNLGSIVGGVIVTNTGAGSLALADSSGDITLSHSASIILGNGTSQEDRSLLADVVRARTAFYGNGYNLTNLNLSSTFGTTDSTGYRGDWGGVLSNRIDALITSTQTLNTATNSLQAQININMPVGVILAYGASNAPTGWLLCDGAAVSRSTYAALFGVVGTTYGAGDASTTFNVPNLVERFPLGATNGLGTASGVSSVTLSVAQIPAHSHTQKTRYGSITNGDDVAIMRPNVNAGTLEWRTDTNIIANAGGGLPHTNMPPNVTVNYIIKY